MLTPLGSTGILYSRDGNRLKLGISGNKKYGENLYMSEGISAQEQAQRSVDRW